MRLSYDSSQKLAVRLPSSRQKRDSIIVTFVPPTITRSFGIVILLNTCEYVCVTINKFRQNTIALFLLVNVLSADCSTQSLINHTATARTVKRSKASVFKTDLGNHSK